MIKQFVRACVMPPGGCAGRVESRRGWLAAVDRINFGKNGMKMNECIRAFATDGTTDDDR